MSINSWADFHRHVRGRQPRLLRDIDLFHDSIIVTGCPRSGTTMMVELLYAGGQLTPYGTRQWRELDAAAVLSGHDSLSSEGRYCFQLTYLHNRQFECLEHIRDNRFIWVLRNPASVVHSMIYNWPRRALNRVFAISGARLLPNTFIRAALRVLGPRLFPTLLKACLTYNDCIAPLRRFHEAIPPGQFLVVDYDDLILRTSETLPAIFDFAHLEYRQDIVDLVNSKSRDKATHLSRRERERVDAICTPVYLAARKFLTLNPRNDV